VANKPMMALGVMPYCKSGSGRPFRTFKTTIMAIKKQRLPIQLRISSFHGIELDPDDEDL
jgi:hypothetical protein